MSKGHKGSRLQLKDQIIPVTFDAVHFSYKNDVNGICYGDLVEPVGTAVYTMRKDGKFGKAVAVEAATSNLINTFSGADAFFDTSNGWALVNNTYYLSSIEHSDESIYGELGNVLKVVDNDGNTTNNLWGGVYCNRIEGLTAGTSYTMKIRYKIENWTTGAVAVWSHQQDTTGVNPTRPNDHILPSSTYDGKWHEYKATVTILTGYNAKTIGIGMNLTNLGCTIYVDAIQFEEKPYDTSFVNGSRAYGILNYGDASYFIPKDQHTVSMWVSGNNGGYGVAEDWSMAFSVSPAFYLGWTSPGYYRVSLVDSNKTQRVTDCNLTTVSPNNWYYIGYTFNNGNIKLFLNGKVVNSSTITPTIEYQRGTSETKNIFIGNYYGTTTYVFNGMISEFVLERIAVSEEEMYARYISNKPFYNPYDYREYAY